MARKFKSKITEYNYYAKMINRNLERLARQIPDSKALQRYKGEFTPLSTTTPYNKRMVNKLVKEARDVYKSGVTSVTYEKRTVALAIKTLRENGIDYVNKRNFKYFMNFLDDARARGLGALYSSTQLIEAFNKAKTKGLSKKDILANIEYWASKKVKYDSEGKIIESEAYKPLRVVSGERLERFKAKAKERARREAKGDY